MLCLHGRGEPVSFSTDVTWVGFSQTLNFSKVYIIHCITPPPKKKGMKKPVTIITNNSFVLEQNLLERKMKEKLCNGCFKVLRWLYCLTILGYNFVSDDLLYKNLYGTKTLHFPFNFCTFDNIMMTSSCFTGNPIFLIIPCFWQNWTTHQVQTLQGE